MLEVCVQSSPWYREEDPEGSFRLIKECGFDGIDYNIDSWLPGKEIKAGRKTDFFDQSVEELTAYYVHMKEAADRIGVKIIQMHAPFPLHMEGLENSEELNEYLLMTVEKCCAVCQVLGCPALVVHPFTYTNKKEEKEINLRMYRRMMPWARKYGVTLCLENMHTAFMGHKIEGACSDVSEVCWYLDTLNAEAGEELFGYCFDVGHANLMSRNIRNYINALGKRLTILHIHDNTGTKDNHMLPYTQDDPGRADWESFIEGLRDIGYTGPLSFETSRGVTMFPKELWADVLKLVSATGQYWRGRIQDSN